MAVPQWGRGGKDEKGPKEWSSLSLSLLGVLCCLDFKIVVSGNNPTERKISNTWSVCLPYKHAPTCSFAECRL